MDDKELTARISELVEEEHEIERGGEPDQARLREIEVELDQCWDLLRQRRARRRAGENPEEASVRPANVVEGYVQ